MLESVSDQYKTQEMCDKAADNFAQALKLVPNCYKTLKMCNKADNTYPSAKKLFPNVLRVRKYVTKLLILAFLYFILFLIDIRLKKCMTELLSKILLC